MRKTRLYLDTSPIIMIEPDQDPIRRAITQEFFRIVAENPGEYELFISPVTRDELQAGTHDKNKESVLFLGTLAHTELEHNKEAENLAKIYLAEDVLAKKHLNDLRHIAYAVVSRCDYVVTWNMRHLANHQTFSRVKAVNTAENYGTILLEPPTFFTKGETNDDR